MNEKELLPCPFDNGVAVIDLGAHWVRCLECCAEGPYANTEAEAIALWNTRKEPVTND